MKRVYARIEPKALAKSTLLQWQTKAYITNRMACQGFFGFLKKYTNFVQRDNNPVLDESSAQVNEIDANLLARTRLIAPINVG